MSKCEFICKIGPPFSVKWPDTDFPPGTTVVRLVDVIGTCEECGTQTTVVRNSFYSEVMEILVNAANEKKEP